MYKDCRLFWVEAGCKVFRYDIFYICMQSFRIGVCGEGMEVGHKEITVVTILNGNKFSQCAEVIAQMKVSGGAYAAEYYFFLFRHDGFVFVYVVLMRQS